MERNGKRKKGSDWDKGGRISFKINCNIYIYKAI